LFAGADRDGELAASSNASESAVNESAVNLERMADDKHVPILRVVDKCGCGPRASMRQRRRRACSMQRGIESARAHTHFCVYQ
jgi:hypothetical protein